MRRREITAFLQGCNRAGRSERHLLIEEPLHTLMKVGLCVTRGLRLGRRVIFKDLDWPWRAVISRGQALGFRWLTIFCQENGATNVPKPFIKRHCLDGQPLSAKTLKMSPGGLETSVLQIIIFLGNPNIVFSFNTPEMRTFQLKPSVSNLCTNL